MSPAFRDRRIYHPMAQALLSGARCPLKDCRGRAYGARAARPEDASHIRLRAQAMGEIEGQRRVHERRGDGPLLQPLTPEFNCLAVPADVATLPRHLVEIQELRDVDEQVPEQDLALGLLPDFADTDRVPLFE